MINPDDNAGAIRFTEYVLPRGEKRDMHVHRPFAITQKAKHILSLGYKFEAEVLTTGNVSLTITGKHCDVGIVICRNGSEVLDAVDQLIMGFDEETARKAEQAMTGEEPEFDPAKQMRLHAAWLETIVKRIVSEALGKGYVVIGEIEAIADEAAAREAFEECMDLEPGSLKADGRH